MNVENGPALVRRIMTWNAGRRLLLMNSERYWTAGSQTGDLVAAIAHFNLKLPGWWFSVGACHVSADATVAPDTAGMDAVLFKTGDREVTRFFDSGFQVDLLPPATMADALIRATDLAAAGRDAYNVRNRLSDAIAALAELGCAA